MQDTTNDEDVLLIFPSPFSTNKISTLQSSIEKALATSNLKFKEILPDGSLMVVKVDDPVKAASVVSGLFGVERVAVAKEANDKFGQLVDAIVEVGKNVINEGDTFAIRVVSNRAEYVGRDVEFTATASLTAELSRLNVRPASEDLCSKLIHAYVSQKSAYVCLFIDTGLGGLPLESQSEEMLCSLHNGLSALSCLMAIKSGFRPRIVLLKTDAESFRESVRNLELIAKRLGKKRMKLHIISLHLQDDHTQPFLIEKISSMILIGLSSRYNIRHVALPLSASIFPPWLISQIVSDTAKVAVPWLPLMLMSEELYAIGSSMGLRGSYIAEDITEIERMTKGSDPEKYLELIKAHDLREIVGRAISTMQTLDVEIGPNYMHEIIDSIGTATTP